MKKVYLAGSIFNNPNPIAWRQAAKQCLPEGWQAIDPTDNEVSTLTPRELVQLDYGLIQDCQAIIARVDRPSWGTAMELAHAKRIDIPVLGWGPWRRSTERLNPWLEFHLHKYLPSLMEACWELTNVR